MSLPSTHICELGGDTYHNAFPELIDVTSTQGIILVHTVMNIAKADQRFVGKAEDIGKRL